MRRRVRVPAPAAIQAPALNLSPLTAYEHGIYAIDSGYYRPRLDAIHLVVEGGQAALVDTGVSHSVPRVLNTLEALGLSPGSVRFIFLTHVHLDHAGGAGALAQRLPEARVVVHPRGLRHMAEPEKLIAGTRAVYGEAEFQRHYGAVLPVPRERLVEAADGSAFRLGGRQFVFLDTPGHARHHHCIWDEQSRSFFTGDTFGISYREFDVDGREFVFPTSTPSQFDPDAAHTSIERLMQYRPRHAFLTHYSRIGHLPRHAAGLHRLLEAYRELAARCAGGGKDRHRLLLQGMDRLLLECVLRHGCALPRQRVRQLMAMDIELNVQGIEIWLDTAQDRPERPA